MSESTCNLHDDDDDDDCDYDYDYDYYSDNCKTYGNDCR